MNNQTYKYSNRSGSLNGFVTLPFRPNIGEEVEIFGEYMVVVAIRHNSEGMELVLGSTAGEEY